MIEGSAGKKTARIASVEFWRFLFTVLVCIYHMEIYYTSGKIFPSGTGAVEFFFVLSGFLLAVSAARSHAVHPEPLSVRAASAQAVQYVWKKIRMIFPVLLVTLIVHIACNSIFYKTDWLDAALHSEWELLFLVGTPFGYNDGLAPIMPLWFLTALFIAGYVYSYLLSRRYELMLYLAPLIGVLGYTYFTLNSTVVLDFYIKMGLLTAGTLRAFTEMALGIAMFRLYDFLRGRRIGPVWNIVLTLLLLFSLWRYYALTVNAPVSLDNFRRIVYILIIVLLSFLKKDGLTFLLDNPVSRWLGSISMTMYVCHFTLGGVFINLVRKFWMRHPMSKFWVALLGYGGSINWKIRIWYMVFVIVCSVILTLLLALARRLLKRKTASAPAGTVVTDESNE